MFERATHVVLQEIVATYLLSGWDGNKRHIVKVVGQTGLEVEKAALTKIEALHVYSVQSISLKSVVSLCEVDLGQNRESLGSEIGAQYSLLGRIVLCNPPKRGKVDAPPRSLPKPTSSNKPQSMVKDTSVARQKNDGSQDLLTRKRRLVTSDSDEEDGAEAKGPASEEKKFKTFINDKGEEVTEMAEAKGSNLQVKKETKAQTSKPKTATKIKQKGIAAFFTKKT